jgi:glycyl-tRNA synthetase beta chain
LAEKLDNLIGFFMIGSRPSGSQDPYALRRQALGMIHIILQRQLDIDLPAFIRFAYENYQTAQSPVTLEQSRGELTDFMAQRLKGVLQEKGYSYDVVESVLAAGLCNVSDCALRVESIAQAKQEAYFADFMTVYTRAHNLSKKWERTEVQPDRLTDPTEKALWQELEEVLPDIDRASAERNYIRALQGLAALRPTVDAFFDAVMIMAEDPQIQANRLGMLKMIAQRANYVAAFTQVVL